MSNSNVRLYQVVNAADPTKRLDIKGLAVKEKEFVISHITTSPEWDAELLTLGETDLRNKFDFKAEQTVTEDEVKAKFGALIGNTLVIKDAVKGADITAVVDSVSVTPATTSTGVDTTVQFTSSVLPALASQDVVWSIAAAANLSINQNGLVTVGTVTLGNYTVTATSAADGTKVGTATLTVA